MKARELIEKEFLSRFFQEDRKYTGVELEFPLLSLSGGSVSPTVISGLIDYLFKNGFKTDGTDIHGNSVFLINEDGDCLSFDNSYNNFEFAMEKDENLYSVAVRFYKLYQLVQNYLLPNNHTLCGLGSNPNHARAETYPVDFPIYRTLRSYLADFAGGFFHRYTDFPAWLSSVQTHLDVDAATLPRALTLFASMDFVRGLLFSNSPAFSDDKNHENVLCFRDYLWEHSGFGYLADNTGPVCGEFKTLDDITDMIAKKSMFLNYRNEQYNIMKPIQLDTFFDTVGEPSDIGGYLSFKNVEITRRGTLEIRSDCAQPLGAAFAPPAFNLGIFHGLSEAETLMQEFFSLLPVEIAEAPTRNKMLRRMVIGGEPLPVRDEFVKALLIKLLTLAEDKLKERGFGEECFLRPLFSRAKTLTNPAKATKERLESGELMAQIITDYANPEFVI
ncbi:MAG: hypothetical protein IJF61_04900 [Clostridia bacterium]|nr:hypothetical protein [Clostridia bacterium]